MRRTADAAFALVVVLTGCSWGEGPERAHVGARHADANTRFTRLGDLTIDGRTGLAWSTFIALEGRTHVQAAAACAARNMRLPTRAELAAVMSAGKTPVGGCRTPGFFRGHTCATVATDTPAAKGDHWAVSLLSGRFLPIADGQLRAGVCVSRGQGR